MRLAQQARVVRMTVTMFEAGGTVRASTRRRIQAACEQAGINFIWSEADGGEGVVLAKPVARKPYLWRYSFDRKFYQAQARLIAAVASDPANTDIRDGLLALARDYKSQAERIGG